MSADIIIKYDARLPGYLNPARRELERERERERDTSCADTPDGACEIKKVLLETCHIRLTG
jgi:hypothetical protein